jgi:hypothetical protein
LTRPFNATIAEEGAQKLEKAVKVIDDGAVVAGGGVVTLVVVVAGTAVQTPEKQVLLDIHARKQPPQLKLSLESDTQVPLQRTSLPGHAGIIGNSRCPGCGGCSGKTTKTAKDRIHEVVCVLKH